MIADPRVELPVEDSAFLAVFEASNDGLVINDAETGMVLEANRAFCKMHGYERMFGLHPHAFMHPNSHHLLEEYIHTVRGGTEFRRRAQHVRRDGTLCDVEIAGRRITYQGRLALLGVVRELTEPARAYQDLEEEVTARTREIEARRQVAESLRELLAVVNTGGSLDDILNVTLAQATRLLQSDAGAVYLVGSKPGVVFLRATLGHGPGDMLQELPLDASVTGAAVAYQRAVMCDVLQAFPARSRIPTQTEVADRGAYVQILRVGGAALRRKDVARMRRVGKRYRTMLSVPLTATKRTCGAVGLYYRTPRQFTEDEVRQANIFAGQATLAIQNAQLHAESERRRREIEALYQADEQIYRSLRLDEVLESLVDVASDLLRPDKVAVGILDAQTERVVVGASRGFSAVTATESVPPDEVHTLRAWLAGGVVAMEDVRTESRLPASIRAANQREDVRSSLTAPIRIGEDVIGAFGLSYCEKRTFTLDEQRLLQSLAQRAALAIQNARLYAQSQQVATLEERQRLARELHDSVTQSLYAVSLYTEAATRALADSDTEQAAINLRDAREATQEALGEMRLLIYELRPPLLEEYGLAAALRARLKGVETRAGLVTEFESIREERLARDTEQELYRVAQEALNNVLKHARATRVTARLTIDNNSVTLEIADDGVGFEFTQPSPGGGFGLTGMRERVERLGGRLSVDSSPGAGTRVSVGVPR